MNGISIIHFNCRSLTANFDKLQNSLNELKHKFDVVAVSETWLDSDICMDYYKLPGYEMCHISRTNKKGGGVAIYINEYISYKLSEKLSTSINNVLEWVTIDICIRNKNVITVCCLYRQPGSNIEVLNETLEQMFRNKKTTIYLCGDFNINLLNYDNHKGTRDCIDVLFSLGLFPLICKPSRITEYSATLIDNIFTNDLNNCF